MPAAQYMTVPLTDLDGSGYLRGDWANVRGETGNLVDLQAPATFVYDRHDDRFEQVMAYYWVTEAQTTCRASASAARTATCGR